ncbi:D-hydantoinase [Pseudovirgaria hyperparasitica]|uniref:D-hydantoinase n=1 Tax=Pseudovirgaria hyperparasitica TaxID=470096 RepID=A0A6A6WDK1_9PEZI|nr:D-hydantoinase [Pseudovirgaria hyperparasitica]KAF2760912.1 D-hydantoinase [Pseudovirgaria hyperparasitica]
MDTLDLVIINGICVTASDIAPYDVGIKGERIAILAPSGALADAKAARRIDAEGGYVMPGGIDCHVHLQEPSMFGKGSSADTYETGTRSAVAGGNTTIVSFAPQQSHVESVIEAIRTTHQLAKGNCYCDYGFHALVANPSPTALSEFQSLVETEGITSLKIYMTYAALQLRDDQILSVLLMARQNKILTMIHAENGDVLDWLTTELVARKLYAPKYHANSRPPILESEATNRAIALSSLINHTPILLVHVSDQEAAKRIRKAQSCGQPIFAETCPQYLFLTRNALDKFGFEGAKHVCSPPPRTIADQDRMWTGLHNGTFSLLSSDHCPFRFDDAITGKKSCVTEDFPVGRFSHIPNGLPGIETRLPLALSLNAAGKPKIALTKFVEVTSTNAAKLYGLYPRKGSMLPGISDADLVIWYPDGHIHGTKITNDILHHDVDYTPYEGHIVHNWPRYTILRGKVVWDRDNGGIVGEKGFGMFLRREVSSMPGVWDTVEISSDFDVEQL